MGQWGDLWLAAPGAARERSRCSRRPRADAEVSTTCAWSGGPLQGALVSIWQSRAHKAGPFCFLILRVSDKTIGQGLSGGGLRYPFTDARSLALLRPPGVGAKTPILPPVARLCKAHSQSAIWRLRTGGSRDPGAFIVPYLLSPPNPGFTGVISPVSDQCTSRALSARSIRPALADRRDGDYTLRWVGCG